jgi:hypothetical protein
VNEENHAMGIAVLAIVLLQTLRKGDSGIKTLVIGVFDLDQSAAGFTHLQHELVVGIAMPHSIKHHMLCTEPTKVLRQRHAWAMPRAETGVSRFL